MHELHEFGNISWCWAPDLLPVITEEIEIN